MYVKRSKPRLTKDYGLSDFYKYYKKMYDHKEFTSKWMEKHEKYLVDSSTYKKIIKDGNKLISKQILEEAKVIQLPAGMGFFKIEKKKMNLGSLKKSKNLKIDWKRTKELGKTVYHLNEHTDYHRYKWHWIKKKMRIPNKTPYSFIACRTNKRAISKLLKSKQVLDYHL